MTNSNSNIYDLLSAAVSAGNEERFFELFLTNETDPLSPNQVNRLFFDACGGGHFTIMKALHAHPYCDPNHKSGAHQSGAALLALCAGRSDRTFLIEKSAFMFGPQDKSSIALTCAAENGQMDNVKALLPLFDTVEQRTVAMAWGASGGHIEMVEFLLPMSNPSLFNNCAMLWSAEAGHLSVVKLLAQHCDPKNGRSESLVRASIHNRQEVFDFLAPLSDPEEAWAVINESDTWTDQHKKMLWDLVQEKRRQDLLDATNYDKAHVTKSTPKL